MKFEYDIAISFANVERNIAYELANELYKTYNLKIFYDDYEQAKLLGSDLEIYLHNVFKNKARYCIIILSKNYLESRWTVIEWKSAFERATIEPQLDYIIPIRTDETKIDGFLNSIGFISLKDSPITKIAKVIYDKTSSEIELIKIIRLAENYYNEGHFEKCIELTHNKLLESNIDALRIRADSFGKLHKYEEAIFSLKKIIKINPNDFLSLFLLGIFNYRIGDYKESVKYYELAKSIYPNHPTILSDLPLARRKMKKMSNS